MLCLYNQAMTHQCRAIFLIVSEILEVKYYIIIFKTKLTVFDALKHD